MFAFDRKPGSAEHRSVAPARRFASTTLFAPAIVQRKCAACDDEEVEEIQRKPALGEPGDRFEQEADRVAGEIVGMADPVGTPPRISPVASSIRRSPEPARAGIEGSARAEPAVAPALRDGQPLPEATRRFFEPRVGHDFSRVRIYADGEADASARSLRARAYTHGEDIVFAAGQYAPHTASGRWLLAHELVHVAQQRGSEGALLQRAPEGCPDRQPTVGHPILLNGTVHPTVLDAKRKLNAYFAGASPDAQGAIGWTSRGAPLKKSFFPLSGGERVTMEMIWAVQVFQNQNGLDAMGEFYGAVERCTWEELDKVPAAPATTATGPRVDDILRLDQTVRLQGLATEQPNYVDNIAVKWLVSAPLGTDYILSPTEDGTGGIAIPKQDFHLDDDPAKGSVAQHKVYRTRAIAEEVLADLRLQSPDLPFFTFYLRDGVIFPTTLSATTAPRLIPHVRSKRDQDIESLRAVGQLANALLWWYVGARFPVRVGGPAVAPARALAGPTLRQVLGEAEYATLKAAAEAAKATSPKLASLTVEEIMAIRAYSQESWSAINAALRLKDVKELSRLSQLIDLMKAGLQKLPIVRGTVTRTIAMTSTEAAQTYRVGATVVEDGFMSTTLGKSVAQREGNILLTIESQTGRELGAAAAHAESEVLFAPGARFLVTDVKQIGEAFLVTLREIL